MEVEMFIPGTRYSYLRPDTKPNYVIDVEAIVDDEGAVNKYMTHVTVFRTIHGVIVRNVSNVITGVKDMHRFTDHNDFIDTMVSRTIEKQ